MSISRWFTPPHLGFLCTVIEMTTQLTKYFCQFTKGEYTTPYWLEVTWRKNDLTWLDLNNYVTWLDLTKNSNDLTWLATRVHVTWLDLWLEQGWLVTTLASCARGKRRQTCTVYWTKKQGVNEAQKKEVSYQCKLRRNLTANCRTLERNQ